MLSCVRQHPPSPCADCLSALARTKNAKNLRCFCMHCSCALFYRRHKRGGRLGVGHSRPVLHATRIFLTRPARPAPTYSANTTHILQIRTFLHVKNNLYHDRTGSFFRENLLPFRHSKPRLFRTVAAPPIPLLLSARRVEFRTTRTRKPFMGLPFKLLLTSFT